MSCLREGGESEEGGGGDRRSHGCHQHHPHYDGTAEQRRHSSSHGNGGGGEVGGEGSSGWVRSRREVEVGSASGGHGGPSGTSLEVGGARRKVPQQVCSS